MSKNVKKTEDFFDKMVNSKQKLPVKISVVSKSESRVSTDPNEFMCTLNFLDNYQFFKQNLYINSSLTGIKDFYQRPHNFLENSLKKLEEIVNLKQKQDSLLNSQKKQEIPIQKPDFHVILTKKPENEKINTINDSSHNDMSNINEKSQKSPSKLSFLNFQARQSKFVEKPVPQNFITHETHQKEKLFQSKFIIPSQIEKSLNSSMNTENQRKELQNESSKIREKKEMIPSNLSQNLNVKPIANNENQRVLVKTDSSQRFFSKREQKPLDSKETHKIINKPPTVDQSDNNIDESRLNAKKESLHNYLINQNPNLIRIIKQHNTPDHSKQDEKLRTPQKKQNNLRTFTPPNNRNVFREEKNHKSQTPTPRNVIQYQRNMMKHEKNEKTGLGEEKSLAKTPKKETKNKWLEKKTEVAMKKEEQSAVHMKINLEQFKKKQNVKTPEKKLENGVLNLSQFQKKGNNVMQIQRNQMFYK